ncbi:MAG TPA: 50S ribosomal protein L18 [Candidatus Nanoarchaeia archaeon]|nr:50S ribosomal protein L18 [Candidatus Nanoarchaeia archaeon]
MKRDNIFTVPFRRKREGRTYYKQRLKMVVSERPRFIVRRSLNNFQAAIASYDQKGDKILLTVNTKALSKLGWKGSTSNLSSAYLVGLLAGKKAIEKGVKEAILDIGLIKNTKKGSIYAVLAGAVDAGLSIPFDPEVLPAKDRIEGAHIAKYALELKKDKDKYHRQFSNYVKKGLNPEDIVKHFNEIKGKING